MKRIIVVCLFIIICYISNAQQLEVIEFHSNPTSIEASKFPKNDLNGERCGLVKLGLVMQEAIFEGNVVHKEYKSGEWWIYLTKGSRWLTIKSKEYLPLQYEFPEPIQSNLTYVMTVDKKDNHRDSEEELFKKCQSSDAALSDYFKYMFYYGESDNRIDEHYNEVMSKLIDLNGKTFTTNSSDNTVVIDKDSNMNNEKEDGISIWLKAAAEELEKEKTSGLEPLNMDEERREYEKKQAEERLNRIKNELEEYYKMSSEEAKEQAPKFGLG